MKVQGPLRSMAAPAFGPRCPATLQSGDHVVVVGAGPAGLTAAYVLSKAGVRVTVLEADSMVGGISRTVQYKGYRFDIGGHRFFTKMRAGRGALARDPRRRVHLRPAAVPDSLQRPVLRLSAQGRSTRSRPRPAQRRPHRAQLLSGGTTVRIRSKRTSSNG